jgi:hypothetical protein
MENKDNTLRLPMLHRMGKDDVDQHWFKCEAIWSMKRIIDEAGKITQLETVFKDRHLMWYMNYKSTTLVGKTRSLEEIK